MERLLLWAAGAGITLHQVFRRHEPTPGVAVGSVVVADLAVYAILARFDELSKDYSPFIILVLSGAVAVTSLLLSIALYRLSPFHPLAQFPGPWDYKLTKLRATFTAYKGFHYKNVKKLHDRYGPIVRVGPNELSISDISAVSAVLGASGLPKDRWYRARQNAPDGNMSLIAMTPGTTHARRRRLWNRGFGRDELVAHSAAAKMELDVLLNQLDKLADADSPVDITKWLRYYSFDFMGRFAFGESFGLLKAGADPHGFIAAVEKFTMGLDIIGHLYWVGYSVAVLPGLAKAMLSFRNFARQCVEKRLARGTTTSDLWYYLGGEDGAAKDSEKISVAEMAREGGLAIVAGSDTSANTMMCTLFQLLKSPDSYARAAAEVDAAIVNGVDIWNNAVDSPKALPYLTACMDETLRLMPVVPTNGSRGVPAGSGGRIIADRYIPENTEIYVSPHVLHHDERYFSPATEEFRPERWIEPGWNTQREAFIPFSAGPSQCVGKTLARIEIILVLSALLHRYELSFPGAWNPRDFEENAREHVTLDLPQLPVCIKRRKV
ncbi:cytochrome P450 [Exidia glandulosa HHB12029]|uniref:Cytochrome P450 n=1 Tax=Exidia glandulosa HHB12029 TaxID=1314781 RepID=A0A165ITK2_EXIGL|nr:cytochrome P450 [Exidia glandulosa HHB12029]